MNRIVSTTISEITQATGRTTKGCVFFLHGSCDNGSGLKSWLHKILDKDFHFSTYRVLYPTAPKLSYRPHENKRESVWFNRFSFDHDAPEDLCSINNTANQLSKLIMQEHSKSGIPLSKMVIGGFSSGGAMALHLGYRFHPQIAGVFALSSYLPTHSELYVHLEENKAPKKPLIAETHMEPDAAASQKEKFGAPNPEFQKHLVDIAFMKSFVEKYLKNSKKQNVDVQLPKLFMSQGFEDPLVKPKWAKNTFKKMRSCGVDALFYTHPKQKHEICKNQLDLLQIWIEDVLTDNDNKSAPNQKTSNKRVTHLHRKNSNNGRV